MKSLLQLSCDQLVSNFSLRCYSYILEVRRLVEHIIKSQEERRGYLPKLLEHIDDDVGVNFHKIVHSEQFLEFSEQDLSTFLSLDSINVVEEDGVFDCLVAWVQHKQEEREKYLPKLLELIRITQFSTHKLSTLESTLEPIGNCEDFLKKVQEYHRNPDSFEVKPRDGDKLILVVCLEKKIAQLKCFDIKHNKWIHLTDIPKEYSRAACGLCVVNGKIILVGGIDVNTSNSLDSVVEWDPDTGRWRNLNNLMIPRYGAKICVLDGNIYIAGGWRSLEDGLLPLDSNHWEVLNLQETHPEWRLWARTNSALKLILADSMVNCGGQIYILDGKKFYLYDSKQDEFVEIVSDEMLTHGRDLAAVDNLVFLISLLCGGPRFNMVHCYNTETGIWTSVADMNHIHHNYKAVGHNGVLYVLDRLGGSMEVYDVERNLWTVMEEKTNHQLASNAFLINRRDILKIISTSD